MEYQKTGKYFAQVTGTLERLAILEVESMGAKVIQEVPRGFRFTADKASLYRILYCSRLVQRVLAPIISFQCHSEKYLYSQARKAIDWTELFDLEQSFGIISNVSASNISHSLYASQLVKDAICDCFRDKYGERPDFDTGDADINFNLHIRDNWASIALDLTGISMHKRGYRQAATFAPLQETLAAAMITLSGWNGERELLDPMCGSGTILAEALMHYCNIPVAYLRRDSGVQFLPDFDLDLHKKICKEANSKIRILPKGLIKGSDISSESIDITRRNLSNLPGSEAVDLRVCAFQNLPEKSGRCIITNPPYGVRLGTEDSTPLLYNALGDFLKQRCPDSEAYILCGSKKLSGDLRLRANWKKNLKNADLEVNLTKIVVRERMKKQD